MKLVWIAIACAACGGEDPAPSDASIATSSREGAITLQSFAASNANGGVAGASFARDESPCTHRTIGACVLEMCASSAGGLSSAGAIQVTGTTENLELTPASDGRYAALQMSTPLFAGGEMLAVSGAGADVPAFHGGVVAPALARITAPARPTGALGIDRTRDFTARWSGGGSEQLQIMLDTASQFLFCRFDATAGTATIPASTLALLPPGTGSFALSTISTATLTAGDYAIEIAADFNGVWQSDNSNAVGTATVQ